MLQCPACNTSNPDGHQFCGHCGSRLASAPHADDTLPPWLAGDTNATQPVPAEHVPLVATQDAQADDHTLPTWLRNHEPVAPTITQPIAQHPTPPTSPHNTGTHNADPNETAPELPFWLNEASTIAAAPTDRTPAAQQSVDQAAAAPIDAQDATQHADENALPAWLMVDAVPPIHAPTGNDTQLVAPEPATTTVSNDALPSWLFGGDAPFNDGGPTPPLGSSLPNTTSEQMPVSANVVAPPKHDDAVSWLADTQAVATPTAATATHPADELPAWLRDDVAMPAPAQQNDAAVAAQDLPAWLRDDPFSSTSSTATAAPDDAVAGGHGSETNSLPAWLRDDAATSTNEHPVSFTQPNASTASADRTAEQLSAAPSVNEALPAWLHDEALGSTSAEPAAQEADEVPTLMEQSALPAWLHGDTGTPTTDSIAAVLVEPPAGESEQPAPAATARVYDAAEAPQTLSGTTNDAAPEPYLLETVAVYDAPAHTDPSEESIAAMLATPLAAFEAAPAPAVAAQAATPLAAQESAQPVVPQSAPPLISPTPVVRQQPAQRGNGVWIMLAIVLVLAVLAVGWLALQLNGII